MIDKRELVQKAEPFCGTWRLQPGKSKYEYGDPLQEALYTIKPEGNGLRFHACWTRADGQQLEMEYYSIPDGQERPSDRPPVAVSTTLTEGGRSLDTASVKNGQVLGLSRRYISDDLSQMTITQSGVSPEGVPFNNIEVYERYYI